MDYKWISECRVCGGAKLRKYLDLGKQPLANQLLSKPNEVVSKYPLQVLFCEECALSQLSIVVDPRILYANYPYHSSVSKTFRKHCAEMAKTLKFVYYAGTITSQSRPLVVDIAANDGCLLSEFGKQNYYVMGVEPSKNLARKCEARGISCMNNFWDEEAAKGVPACDIITATNVLAHVDDLKSFILLAKKKLRVYSKGFMVVEVPYLWNLISKNQFDTIYHEHLSYFLFRPLKKLFESCKMPIFRVEEYPIHGGSLRIYASPYERPIEKSVGILEREEAKRGLYDFRAYSKYAKKVRQTRDSLRSLLEELSLKKKRVVGYGASAKGSTLMNYCGLDNTDISAIVDDTPAKQGRFTTNGIPITSAAHFDTNHPDYIALLSWNFSGELKDKTKHLKARYIVTVPNVKIE